MNIKSKYLEKYLLIFFFLLSVSLISSNPLLTFISLITLPILVKLSYRKGFTAVFTFMLIWQWIQVTIKVFYANFLFISVSELADTNAFAQSVVFSLLGLIALAGGIFVTTSHIGIVKQEVLRTDTKNISEKKLFILWIVFSLVNSFLSGIMFRIMPLQQIFVGLLNIKMVIIAALLFVSFLNNKNKKYVYFVIGAEILLGFTTYFSGFKTILFYLLIITATIYPKLTFKITFRYATVLGLILLLGITWILIRGEYRTFLNQGTGMQVVNMPMQQRLQYLGKLISEVSFDNFERGIEETISRTSYSDFLAQVMDRVPEYNSYENGRIFINTLKHIFMPRLFFPQKVALDESEVTIAYTGRQYSGTAQGTSIGLGYMAYYYIDFGKYIMLIFIFFQGMLFGWVYNLFAKRLKKTVLLYSITLPIFMGVYLYETSQPKIIGGLLSSTIIMLLLTKYFLKYFVSYIRISK